ncbi:class I SAM-dependent methyltransferase [bacterium]|nr:class I SAM-dependent methyltransferase [bacterium]
MDKKFEQKKETALEARYAAQKIAFAPVVFQAVRLLRDLNILKTIKTAGEQGLRVEVIAKETGVSEYGVTVLCETGLSQGVLEMKNEHYILTRVGHFLLNDEMTRVNMDFINDVCYEGLFALDKSIAEGKPAGLKVFGEWDTVYEALSQLPPKAQKSWFAFDHYYSDSAFPEALPIVFKQKPRTLLDVGGNTGKFALQCADFDPDIKIAILDLPGQLAKAAVNIKGKGLEKRIEGKPVNNLLDPEEVFPKEFDAVWMSQFLVCFSEEQVVSLLARAREALEPQGDFFILDTYWDRQKYDIAAYCLINSSPYFTAMANGNSRMYRYSEMERFIMSAGLKIEAVHDHLGMSHTLIHCKRK